MSRLLKLGFIGGGLNSAVGVTHLVASQMDCRFRATAGCFSRDPCVNEETARRWDIAPARTYSYFPDMLSAEAGNLDAIVILTPTPSHLPIVLQALEYKYPVICEKALAASPDEAKSILMHQERNGGFLVVTYNYTGYPMLRELREIIRCHELGRVRQIQIEMPQEGFARVTRDGIPVTPQPWRLKDGAVPTVSLDLGVHLHNIVGFLSGETPMEVIASLRTFGRFEQVVDDVVGIARYTGGLECSFWFGKAALGYRNGLRVRVFGTKASAEWTQMDPEYLIINTDSGERKIIDRGNNQVLVAHEPRYNRFKSGHPAGFLEAFANLYTDIADALINFRESGQQPSGNLCGADIALEGLLMLRAMADSAVSGAWTAVRGIGA